MTLIRELVIYPSPFYALGVLFRAETPTLCPWFYSRRWRGRRWGCWPGWSLTSTSNAVIHEYNENIRISCTVQLRSSITIIIHYTYHNNIILLQCKIVIIFIITRTVKVWGRVGGWRRQNCIVCNFISNYVKYDANSNGT